MTSDNDTTTSAPTNPWGNRRPHRCISRPGMPFRAASQESNIPDTSKSDGSAATAAYDGTPSGSASAMCWGKSTSGSRRSITTSGRYSSDPSVSGALTSEIQRSRTTAVENTGKMCYLCLQTKMSPISPAAHLIYNKIKKYIFYKFLQVLLLLLN